MTARRNRKAIRTMNQMECRHELRVCVGRGRGERSATAASEALSLPSCIGPDYRRRHLSATRAERAQRGQRTCMPSQTEIRFAHKASEVPHEPKLLSTFANYLCLSGAFCVRPTGKNRDPGGHARRPGITGHLKRRRCAEKSKHVPRVRAEVFVESGCGCIWKLAALAVLPGRRRFSKIARLRRQGARQRSS